MFTTCTSYTLSIGESMEPLQLFKILGGNKHKHALGVSIAAKPPYF